MGCAFAEHCIDLFNDPFEALGITGVAFPYGLNPPAKRSEFCSVTFIACHVRRKFGTPIIATRLWARCEPTFSMLVPKTAMNENREPVFREDDIGLARKIPSMQPEPKAKRMKGPPHCDLRLRS